MSSVRFLCVACVSLIGSACSVFTSPEPEPSWIHIDRFELVDNPNVDEGSLSHDITDAWVFVDEEMIGIFELPADIPILQTGDHRLLIGPGIKVSTISTLRDNYVFYGAHEQVFHFAEGERTTLVPQVQYRDEGSTYKYMIVEDFEDVFSEMEAVEASEVQIERTTDPENVFEGTGSGLFSINDTVTSAGFRTSGLFDLPQNGKAVYMEFDYYTEYELTIGVHINNTGFQDETVDYLTLKKYTDGARWKKAYVALTSIISAGANPESEYIYFLPQLSNEGAPEEGIVLIDNIKVLYEVE